MKLTYLALSLGLLLGGVSCKRASFENIVDSKGSGTGSSDDLKGNGIENPNTGSSGDGTAKDKPVLVVTVASPEVKAGGDTDQAKATIKDGSNNPEVTWKIEGPAGRTDIGTIDDNGLYKSPATADKEFPVIITAVLKSDPTVTASVTIKVLPPTQIFARCLRNNVVFPILAVVYQINSNASAIPVFTDPAQARKVTTVCMDKYAVAPRDFNTGFPDVPDLIEYFALQTTTTLIIPAEGDYTFALNSDDGSKLSIDGKPVIDNDGLHQALGTDPKDSPNSGQKTATVHLTAGDHPVSLDYFQGPRLRIALELKWQKPGSTTFEYVPRESFK